MTVKRWYRNKMIGLLLVILLSATHAVLAAERSVTLNVKDVEVREILSAIAAADGVNIIVDESVKGKMSMHIRNMPMEEALNLVVKTRGFTYQRMPDGTIVVAEAKNLLAGFGTGTVFPVKYALAVDLKKALAGSVPDDRLKVDEPSNALIFYGAPAETEQVRATVETLDFPRKQVTVEAQVLEINKSDSKSLGVDWSFSPVVQSGNSDDLANYGAISFGKAADGNPYQLRFKAQINALVSKGNAKVLAKPKISTISGKEAKILIGDKVPVQSQTTSGGTTSTTITYIDTGIKLVYTPVIGPDGLVRAHLLAEVSTPSAALGGTNYKIATRTAETDLVMTDGEAIAIGGLISTTKSHTGNKVPLLGDLPLVGSLFKSTTDSSEETEILIILTAKINK